MLYPIPLSTGVQLALGIAINLLAIVLLWGPFFYLRRRYKGKSQIPFRARLITFLTFAVFFVAFWWGYLLYDAYIWDIPGKEWIHGFLSKWTYLVDYVSAIALPAYIFELIFSKNKSKNVFAKIFVISLSVILSLGLHIWFLVLITTKSIVAKLS